MQLALFIWGFIDYCILYTVLFEDSNVFFVYADQDGKKEIDDVTCTFNEAIFQK